MGGSAHICQLVFQFAEKLHEILNQPGWHDILQTACLEQSMDSFRSIIRICFFCVFQKFGNEFLIGNVRHCCGELIFFGMNLSQGTIKGKIQQILKMVIGFPGFLKVGETILIKNSGETGI